MENWIVACGAGTLLARAAFALYSCGVVRAKNSGATLLRHFADLCLAALAFWAVGIAILKPSPASSFIQPSALFGLRAADAFLYASPVFLILCITLLSTGIVVGTLSERTRFWPSLAPSLLLGGVLVPLLFRWTAAGWLATRAGFHDCAGASFIHLAAATCAAVAAIVVGPRTGKYNRDGSSNVIPGHSLPLAGAGAMLLLVAWLPYVLAFAGRWSEGSVGNMALNVLLAAAAGGITSLAAGQWRFGKPDISLTIAGAIGGLVSITAGADVMSNLAAVTTGAVAGLLVPWAMLQIEMVWKIDDPTGAIAIHGVGGAWALVATGLLARVAPETSRLKLIGAQLLGLAVTVALVGAATYGLFTLLKSVTKLRASEADEFDGLDLAEHDIGSYPDFQQTMIKSYHLRET